MKNQIKTIVCALLIAVTTPMFAAENQQVNKGKSLKTGIYFSKDGKLNINVENSSEKATKIQIKDVNNQVVFQKSTQSTNPLSALKLDVGQLPDGAYKVVVSNGSDKITHNLQLETPKAERVLIVGN